MMFAWKDRKQNEKEAGGGPFKKHLRIEYNIIHDYY